jgi:hypothetical protein
MPCITDKQTIDFLTGELSQEGHALVARHLDDCDSCRKRLVEVREIHDGLAPKPGEFDDPALQGEIMNLISLGRGQVEQLPKMAERRGVLKWGPAIAVAAAVPLVITFFQLLPSPSPEEEVASQFTSRGAPASSDQWVSLTLFRRVDTGERAVYQPVDKTLPPKAPLAFAYEDRSATPYPYLMVFAVTARGDTLWYFPEDREPNGASKSIHVGDKGGRVTLADEVTHDLAAGPIRFFGLFSKTPITVLEVEAAVTQGLEEGGRLEQLDRLMIENTGQWSRLLSVASSGE